MKGLTLILLLCLPITVVAGTILPPGFQEELVVYGLQLPTGAAYAPDGRLFITEKQGALRIFKDGTLLPQPFLRVSVNSLSERGLDGIVLDPNFTTNHYVYIYYTTSGASPKNQLERWTANGDVAAPGSRKILLRNIRSDAGFHNGGGLVFGKDGKLYVSTGDGGEHPELAQTLTSANGKILRINSDGSIPSDNPFYNQSGDRKEIFCYGLRNPYRFRINLNTGVMIIGDVGGDLYEEINVGKRGSNYGWPIVEGPANDSRFTPPVYDYDHSNGGAAVIVGPFYTASQYPQKYRGMMFFTDYVRGFIKTIGFDSNGNPGAVNDFGSGLIAPSDMILGSDGTIQYVSINSGEIRRIRYVGGNNRPPVVEASSSKRAGISPLTVHFQSNGTYDPDGDPLKYFWDFGDGTFATQRNSEHTYRVNGTYYVVLTAKDNHGGTTSSRSLKVVVGNLPPTAIITTPLTGTTIHVNERINFSGRGSDPEDGTIDPQNMLWSAKIFHNEHTHPFLNGVRGPSGSVTMPPTLHGSGTLFLRLYLRVTDSSGLSREDYVDLPWVQ